MALQVGHDTRDAGREHQVIADVKAQIARVIVGQEALVDRLLIALVTANHALIEGVPGLAKTLTVSTLAHTLRATFARIQFTPDLLPADLIGTLIYNPSELVIAPGVFPQHRWIAVDIETHGVDNEVIDLVDVDPFITYFVFEQTIGAIRGFAIDPVTGRYFVTVSRGIQGTFLYTLFLGVRPELVLQKLKKTANFVSQLMSLDQWIETYEVITAYLSSVSPEFEQKFKDMKYDFVTPAEKAAKAFETNYMAPRLREAHKKGLEEGIEKGIKKGIEKGRMEGIEKGIEKGIEQILKAYISQHLYLSDETIAGQFQVSEELVQRLRAQLSA
mgnify:CR=1 FL=1